ncbi:PREDICTED: U1 small nuclear ribonucleoprotein C-like [Chinchilla lanigera]|uniref:U1 small nuclear ribonucleoprotein C-like n=1 Tax=Chinchilla lanigera TaxID=34839 RepID=UPI00038EA849|nr:PREDICTED: U1 small nuclear ribonucleoprotein C-like [Chinchilla lanigera]
MLRPPARTALLDPPPPSGAPGRGPREKPVPRFQHSRRTPHSCGGQPCFRVPGAEADPYPRVGAILLPPPQPGSFARPPPKTSSPSWKTGWIRFQVTPALRERPRS